MTRRPRQSGCPRTPGRSAPPPRCVPVLLARLVLGESLTEWITTMRGASNRAAVSALGWKPRFPSWREGFVASLSPQG